MDGNQSLVQVPDLGDLSGRGFTSGVCEGICRGPVLPSLDAGFRHPCRNDGPPTLVYNDENSSLVTSGIFCGVRLVTDSSTA